GQALLPEHLTVGSIGAYENIRRIESIDPSLIVDWRRDVRLQFAGLPDYPGACTVRSRLHGGDMAATRQDQAVAQHRRGSRIGEAVARIGPEFVATLSIVGRKTSNRRDNDLGSISLRYQQRRSPVMVVRSRLLPAIFSSLSIDPQHKRVAKV